MKIRSTLIILASALLGLALIGPSQVHRPISRLLAATAPAAATSTTLNPLVTLYGWPDNSPPGDAIAYPQDGGYPTIHNAAGGTGTYQDPITFATDQAELPIGTIVYYGYLHRYFIMEDDCTACDEDWTGAGPDGGPGFYHIDLWVGGEGGNTNDVINCEDSLTQTGSVIVDPPSNEPVDTTPLFNSSTNSCYNPSSFTGGGSSGSGSTVTGAITGYGGLCVDVRGANSANSTPVQVYTCNGTNAQQWTVAAGNTLQALGNCMDIVGGGTSNGTLVDLYACNGTGAQVWQPQSDGALYNPQSGKCLDDTGSSTTPGTQLQISSCTGGANQAWTLPGG
jgi:hypothetical protein